MNTQLITLSQQLAKNLNIAEDHGDLIDALKQTAFKSNVSDAQLAALLIVANQYKLNPWTKEIYAFPGRNNDIIPVVSVDGWARIINSHPQFDGIEFDENDEKCTCIIYRKDRSHPVKITEYMSECRRATEPWKTHSHRMLRHKALIQCARIAFSYAGIYDSDEAERIAENTEPEIILADCPDDKFNETLPVWKEKIESGKLTPNSLLKKLSQRYHVTDSQRATIIELGGHSATERLKNKIKAEAEIIDANTHDAQNEQLLS